MTRQQNRSKIIRNSVWLFGLHEVVFDRDTCIYAFEKVRKERHAEPHTVHWGMKIDFLLSLSFFFLHGHEMIFFFLFFFFLIFYWMCVYGMLTRQRKRNSFIIKFFFCLPLDEKRKKEKRRKVISFLFTCICFCFVDDSVVVVIGVCMHAYAKQQTFCFLSFFFSFSSFHIIDKGPNECELSSFSSSLSIRNI